MEYVYAALLLHNAGKEVTEEAITAVLESAGVEVNVVRVKALTASLEDIDITEAIEKAAFAAPAAAAPAASVAAPAAVEEAAAEETAEEAEESGMEGLGALFG
ncbi:MAG: 50S ribosomal protein P1 [Methanosarcinales archaeon]|nr:50S ribosomal protein P1 [ANME-2 cluster archaeon]MDF1531148.1 50S ribosomal protein P1 [ANME-2 cluster archaeon]MDW7777197.1 50S ribosomal protein P1 [Methanosarcinales archaeon]